MAGLLDNFNLDDPQTMGLLNAGLTMLGNSGASRTPMNLGQILGGGLQAYTGTQDQFRQRKQNEEENAYMRQMRDFKMNEIKQSLADRESAKQFQAQLPNIVQQFGEDYQGMIRAGVPADYVKQLAESRNYGRSKVARTMDVSGEGGAKLTQQFDDYGQPIGSAVSSYVAPQLVNQGDRQSFVTPRAGQSFKMGVSPSDLRADARFNRQMNQSERQFQQGRTDKLSAKQAPMSATLQKELMESDDITQSSRNVIDTLQAAREMNKKAYSGWGAKGRASIVSNLGGTEAADATVQLDNLMTGQALESLKATFGGMPTEGERKILLEMQASADKTPSQREEIMKRAIDLAERRERSSAAKAKAIRAGTYLTEGFEMPKSNFSSAGGWSMQKVD